MGNLLQNHLGKYTESEAAYRKALKINPNYTNAWNNLGSLLKNHLGNYTESEAAYRKALKINPNYTNAWNGLGFLLKNHLGNYTESEAAYRKALKIDPNYTYAWNGLGLLQRDYFLDLDQAKESFTKGLELPEDDTTPYLNMNMGFLLFRKEKEEAIKFLKKAQKQFIEQYAKTKDSNSWVNGLLLCVLLYQKVESQKLSVEQNEKIPADDKTLGLFLYAYCIEDKNSPANWHAVKQSTNDFEHFFYILRVLRYMAEAYPEKAKVLEGFAKELLADKALQKTFKDVRPAENALQAYMDYNLINAP